MRQNRTPAKEPEIDTRASDMQERIDPGTCCLCGQPRPDGFRLLCSRCARESARRAIEIGIVLDLHQERMTNRRASQVTR